MRRKVTNGSASTHSAAPRFDYASLAHDVRIEVGAQASAIRELNGESLAGKVEIGRRLIVIRKAVGPGDFQPLVSDVFDWTKGTTSNYMSVARAFGKLRPRRLSQFEWSALVILSRGKAKRSARAEALSRARTGENIGKALAEAIVLRHLGLPAPDLDAERLVNRVFQALSQFESHHGRVAPTQRDRVMQRLVALANLLNYSPSALELPEIEEEELSDEDAWQPTEVCLDSGDPSFILAPTVSAPELLHRGAVTAATTATEVNPLALNAEAAPAGKPEQIAVAASADITFPALSSDLVDESQLDSPRELNLHLNCDAGETSAPQLRNITPLTLAKCSSSITEPADATSLRSPSRRTFLAGIGLALAALFGQRSIASAGSSAPLPARNGLPPPDSAPNQEKPADDAQRQIVRRVASLKGISTKSNSSGQIVQTTYTYSYDASTPKTSL